MSLKIIVTDMRDGMKILIYNTKGTVINVKPEVYTLLRYIGEGEVKDEYTQRLNSSVAGARHNRKWRVEYMKTFVHDIDVRREGIEIGKELGKELGVSLGKVYAYYEMGCTIEDIAEKTGMPIAEIEGVLSDMQS